MHDIRIEVKSGDFVGLLGSNGSGKTTLLKIIDGLLKPSKGNVMLDGTDIRKLSPGRSTEGRPRLPKPRRPALRAHRLGRCGLRPSQHGELKGRGRGQGRKALARSTWGTISISPSTRSASGRRSASVSPGFSPWAMRYCCSTSLRRARPHGGIQDDRASWCELNREERVTIVVATR